MKKKILLFAAAATLLLSLTACSGGAKDEKTVLTIGATPVPHVAILEKVKPMLAEEGIDLQITEYTDYVIPNTAVDSGDLDANFFQHITYMNDFNAERKTQLVSVGEIHFEPLGIYAGKTASLADLKEGAQVSIPSDATNEGRALMLLQTQGLIKLKEGAGLTATPNDIVENKLGLIFLEVEAAAIPRTLQDVDIAVINGNYALQAGLSTEQALAIEDKQSEAAKNYANVIVVKKGNENNEAVKKLVEALQTEEIKNFINETYKGSVVPLF